MQTALFEVASLLNERPIGVKPGSDIDNGRYLCPNDLLLGRTNNRVPMGIWDEGDRYSKRIEHVQQIVNDFWKRWMRDYFPTLLVRQKWHHERRNVKKGDIVLVSEANMLKGLWKMAEVVEAEPGRDGKVRDVAIRYNPNKLSPHYKGEQDIRVMRSVHKLIILIPVEEIQK